MVEVLRVLKACVPVDVEPILLLDCAPCHLDGKVLAEAKCLGIGICPIPPHLTWLVQPADVHLFSGLKQHFRRCYRRRLLQDGQMTASAFLEMLSTECQHYLCSRTWRGAFEQLGFCGDAVLTKHLQALFPHGLPVLAQAPLTAEELRQLLPKGHTLRAGLWSRRVLAL